jgi:hypothetical protein
MPKPPGDMGLVGIPHELQNNEQAAAHNNAESRLIQPNRTAIANILALLRQGWAKTDTRNHLTNQKRTCIISHATSKLTIPR